MILIAKLYVCFSETHGETPERTDGENGMEWKMVKITTLQFFLAA